MDVLQAKTLSLLGAHVTGMLQWTALRNNSRWLAKLMANAAKRVKKGKGPFCATIGC
jgi:hypothetical protein